MLDHHRATRAVDSGFGCPGAPDAVVRAARDARSPPRWCCFLAELAAQLLDGPAWLWWALYLACYVTGGWEPGLAGLRALREKTLDVDLLMVVAAIGAAAIGQVMDGGLLIVIFATSGALEAVAAARTEDSVRGLLGLAPTPPRCLPPVATSALSQPSTCRSATSSWSGPPPTGPCWPGSEVDQATITGEPLPVDKATGDEVFAGTLNGTGALRVRVGRRAGDSVVARSRPAGAPGSPRPALAGLLSRRLQGNSPATVSRIRQDRPPARLPDHRRHHQRLERIAAGDSHGTRRRVQGVVSRPIPPRTWISYFLPMSNMP